jgi:hypothetical protein
MQAVVKESTSIEQSFKQLSRQKVLGMVQSPAFNTQTMLTP